MSASCSSLAVLRAFRRDGARGQEPADQRAVVGETYQFRAVVIEPRPADALRRVRQPRRAHAVAKDADTLSVMLDRTKTVRSITAFFQAALLSRATA
jgi:hypothetical protein